MANISASEPLPDTAPANEVARRFGEYRRKADVTPVTVTDHGRPTHVLLSVDEYRRLKRRDREALSIDTMSEEQLRELLAALDAQELPPSDELDAELEGWTP